MTTIQIKHRKLKKQKIRNIILNLLCVVIAVSGLWWTVSYFWRYFHYCPLKMDKVKN